MKILFIGDIVDQPGRETVREFLPQAIKENEIDFVIANAENLAHGRGATLETIQEMQIAGVNYFTSGDHIFWQKGFDEVIESLPVLRPANLPGDHPGKGYAVIDSGKEGDVLLINLMGRTFLNERLDDPFQTADKILEEHKDAGIKTIIVDFHSNATSEKYAFAHYLDGKVTAVLGTHTHVPTSDTLVLPQKTLYVTDAGMTGIIDSVLGVKKEIIIKLYTTGLNQRFFWEDTGRRAFRSVVLDTQKTTISRFDKEY